MTRQKAHKRGKNTRVIHGFQKLVFHFKLQALPQQQHGKLRPREIKRFFCLHVIRYCSKTHAIAVMLSNPARTKTRAHRVLLRSKHQKGSGSKMTKPSDWKSITSDPAWNLILSNAAINHTETKTTLFFPPLSSFHHEMDTALINQVYYLWFVFALWNDLSYQECRQRARTFQCGKYGFSIWEKHHCCYFLAPQLDTNMKNTNGEEWMWNRLKSLWPKWILFHDVVQEFLILKNTAPNKQF